MLIATFDYNQRTLRSQSTVYLIVKMINLFLFNYFNFVLSNSQLFTPVKLLGIYFSLFYLSKLETGRCAVHADDDRVERRVGQFYTIFIKCTFYVLVCQKATKGNVVYS